MRQRRLHSTAQTASPARPGTGSLLLHILRGTLLDGMQLPAVLGIGLVIVLYQQDFPWHDTVAGLLVGGFILVGLFRGCASWQQELEDHRRQLARLRQQSEAGQSHAIPGFIPYTHR